MGDPPAPPTPRSSPPQCGLLAPAVRSGPSSDAGIDPPAARTPAMHVPHRTKKAGRTADAVGPAHTADAAGPAHAADRPPDQPRRAVAACRHHTRHRVRGTG
ncbi:hypothetical protein TNCT6_62050 [Streptomyces sp. 6-11-2]|nr:hypothetical protein TNCT6_62050 [Streptomyces sp. 6-11-2]